MILIFDGSTEQLAAVSLNQGDAMPYYEPSFVEQLNQDLTFEVSFPANHADSDFIKEGNILGFIDLDGDLQAFTIYKTEKVHTDNQLEIVASCEHLMYELLDDIVEDLRVTGGTAQDALTKALTGSRWQVGLVDNLGTADINFYYTSCLQNLKDIVATYGGELRYRLTFDGGKITGRYVDLLEHRGVLTGRRFEYNVDTSEIKRTVDRTNLKTALYGRGAASEYEDTGGYSRKADFSTIEWKTANGNPVDKPLGQEWVGDPTARALYGRAGGTRHLIGTQEFSDITDPAQLLQATWDALQLINKPTITYEITVADLEKITGLDFKKVRLGDTVVVIDREFKPFLAVNARVIELDRDLSDPGNTKIVLGNYTDNFTDTIENRLGSIEGTVANKAIWDKSLDALASANGKNMNYYQASQPTTANERDRWFRKNPDGTISALIYENGAWVNPSVDEVKQARDVADAAVASADALQTQMTTKVDNDTFTSTVTQLSDDINLRVEKNDVLNQINISDEGILIDGNKVHITGQTSIDDAVIQSAMIAEVDAGVIVTGTLDTNRIAAGSITVDKLSVDRLSSINSDLGYITGGDLRIGDQFHVDGLGNLWAVNADLSGKITATSGALGDLALTGQLTLSMVTNDSYNDSGLFGRYDYTESENAYHRRHMDGDVELGCSSAGYHSNTTVLSSGTQYFSECYYGANGVKLRAYTQSSNGAYDGDFSNLNNRIDIFPNALTMGTVGSATSSEWEDNVKITADGTLTINNIYTEGGHVINSIDGGDLYFESGTSYGNSLVTVHAASFSTTSLEELKQDIATVSPENSLNRVLQTGVYSYRLKDDVKRFINNRHIGFVIKKENNDIPSYYLDKDETGISLYDCLADSFGAIHALSDRQDAVLLTIDGVKNDHTNLVNEVSALKADNEALRSSLSDVMMRLVDAEEKLGI